MVDVEIVGGEQELLPDCMTAFELAGCVVRLRRRHSDSRTVIRRVIVVSDVVVRAENRLAVEQIKVDGTYKSSFSLFR